MNATLQSKLRKIDPYVPGEQPKIANPIKLNANENPYPPSPAVTEVLRSFDASTLRLYPDAQSRDLRQALADKHAVDFDQVFVGNGSDDVLALCYQAFFCSNLPILYPDLTYSFYPVWSDLFQTPVKNLPLTADFSIDVAAYTCPNGGIILPNPNAPTGKALPLADVEILLQNNPESVVIIDEAYVDFGTESAIALLPKYENLVVVQTMSKSRSLAGMRIGYAIANPALIAVLDAVKNSYNSYTMDMVALACGAASVRDDAYFQQVCNAIIDTRTRTQTALCALGFDGIDSKANFILATHPQKSALEIFTALRDRSIFVRYFKLPRVDNHLRISVGTDAEMDALLTALGEILG